MLEGKTIKEKANEYYYHSFSKTASCLREAELSGTMLAYEHITINPFLQMEKTTTLPQYLPGAHCLQLKEL